MFVEWLNVTGGFDFGALHNYAGIETMRSGAVWVGLSQAGAAVWFDKAVLGGLEPKRLIAFGWSQSASRLTTYVNALAPSMHVYNAYLLRSRVEFASPLSAGIGGPTTARVRTDLDVPIFVLETEGDVLHESLGYAPARQPDTRLLRTGRSPAQPMATPTRRA